MTSKLTREQLHERARENVKALKMASRQHAFESAREEILADLQLAELALAAMDCEPVIIVGDDGGDALAYRRLIQSFAPGTKLYRHAQPAPLGNEFTPKNLDRALGVLGMALPESKEEFNLQSERWIQRLIDRVIRYADEFKEQPAPVVPDGLLSMAASAIEDLLEHTDPNTSYYSGVWADVPGKLRAAMIAAAPQEVKP